MFSTTRWGTFLACLLLLAGCDGALSALAMSREPGAGAQQRPLRQIRVVVPTPAVRLPDPPPPPHVPDPEEEARAREAAERAAFEAQYPKHGITVHYLAQIFAQPSNKSRVIGYMRRGATFRAAEGLDGAGCPGGWHKVPGDGYVCHGRGYLVGDAPQTYADAPVNPALDAALPYAYARTGRDDVPQFWRLPTPEEEREAVAIFERLRAEEDAAEEDAGTHATAGASSNAAGANAAHEGTASAQPAETPQQADEVEAPPPPGQTEDTGAHGSTFAFPEFLRMRMLKGFYVSLDRSEQIEGQSYFRTVRGGYVPEDALVEASPPPMRGVVLGGAWTLPIAISFRPGARQYHLDANERVLEDGQLPNHTPLAILRDDVIRGGRRFIVGRDGRVAREPALRIIRPLTRPPGVPDGARWIHVSLTNQALVAYEGDVPVFATLVSTGKPGHETPTGLFQIQSKHVSATMDDEASPDGAYSIEDVPWTMYFQGNFALHGAFWHNAFGNVRSHGCVNLAPADARWLFQWTTPVLPASWHGRFADRRHQGTWVYIEP